MTLRFEPDVSHADWWATRDEPWAQLCTIGPSGFAAYAQLLHPLRDGDDLTDPNALLQVEGDVDDALLAALVDLLTPATATPDNCLFGLWDGFGDIPEDMLAGSRVRIPNREYLLFRGSLDQAGQWGAADLRPGWPRPINSPNLIWPDDRAWFACSEIDQSWTGVGGSRALIDALVTDPRIDAREVHHAAGITDPRSAS